MLTALRRERWPRMSDSRGSVAITGAYGYLGTRIRAALDRDGWHTHALVREPRVGDRASPWSLAMSPPPREFEGFVALVHCAYDFRPHKRVDVWQTNVAGTARLFEAAHAGGVERIVAISSMSAYAGTTQIYGQVKLAIEEQARRVGGIALRPGLIYGVEPGGMVGALLRAARLPIVPLIAGGSLQHPVRDDDVARVVAALLACGAWRSEVFGVAQADPMSFRDVLTALTTQHGGVPRFIPVPWRLAYFSLRLIEAFGLRAPFRSDSVLGLARPAPGIAPSQAYSDLLHDVAVLSVQKD
jgi:nucleoside-diphosphate-sugar epimerase